MGITRYVTEQEYLELKEKHDALAAQVEFLKQSLIDATSVVYHDRVMGTYSSLPQKTKKVLATTPAACLAQVRAEAVEEFAKDVLAEIGAATTYQHVIDILNRGIRK